MKKLLAAAAEVVLFASCAINVVDNASAPACETIRPGIARFAVDG